MEGAADAGGYGMDKSEKRKINASGWVMIAISIMILFT